MEPVKQLPGVAHYYLGSDQKTWLTDIPTYAQVRAKSVYPGIDLVYYGNEGQLEYDFILQPGADPERIALSLSGPDSVSLDSEGNLAVVAAGRKLRVLKPNVYQLEDGNSRRSVAGAYRIHEVRESGRKTTEVTFQIAAYDRLRTLVIDPVLTYAEITPGTEVIRGIQVDSSGNIYIPGQNTTNGALQVTKLASDATTVLYIATISGSSPSLTGFAVDSSGRAYLSGYTGPGYPTTTSAYQQNVGSGTHVVFTALDAIGHVSYSTYLAGSSQDYSEELTADATGKAYILGETCSADFPQTMGTTLGTSCYQPFVVKMDPSLSGAASLVYSNILATSNAYALAAGLDSSNNLYVLVDSFSSALQSTSGALNYGGVGSPNGVFVEQLNSSGTPGYIAYVGPGTPFAIAVEPGGAAYVAGRPGDYDFPTIPGDFDTNYPGGFVSKISGNGSTLLYSTFLSGPSGTTSNITPTSLALNPSCVSNCSVYFGGYTTTADMPVQNPIQAASLDPNTNVAFLGQLNATGTQANFLTYLGGSNGQLEPNCGDDTTCAPYLTADSQGNIYTALLDTSSDFPVTTGTAGSPYNYIAKISPSNAAFLLAVPGTLAFPSQPVGIGTSPVPPPNNYVNVNEIVVLRNMGSAALSISSIIFSDPEFSETNNCSGGLAAGGTCQVQVEFDPSQSGPRNGTMTVNSNASDSATAVQLSGTGNSTGVLQLSTAELDFGSVTLNSSSSLPVTLTNVGSASMQFNYISITAPYSQTNNCPSILLPSASCTANIVFNPVSVGFASTSAYFSVNVSNYLSSNYVTLTGTGTGVGAPGFTVSSSAMSFPSTVVGSISAGGTSYVALQNTGTIPITVNNIIISGDFQIYSNQCGTPPAPIVPQSECDLYLQFAPTAKGTRTGTLSITSSLSTAPVTVSLTGVGLSGTQGLVFSETSVTYLNTPVGSISSLQEPIQINNVGNAPVTFYRVYDNGGDFHITSDGCSGLVLTNSTLCDMYVEFVPTKTGARSGTLTFVDSATGSPQTITLSGNGLADTQVAVLNPTTLVFSDTVVGTTGSEQAVTFYNSGDVPITITNVQSDNSTEFPIASNGCTGSVSSGSICYVYTQFTPAAAGTRSAHLSFTDSAPGSPHVALLTGLGLSPTGSLEMNPTAIPFGTEAIGVSTATQQIVVTNPGDSTVNITSVSSSSADFAVSSNSCVTPLAATGTCYMYVAFNPSAVGARAGTITIASSNAPSQGVSLTGTGVAAAKSLVVISPAPLAFGTVTVSSSNQQQIILRNVGTETITFGDITVSSALFTLSNGCGGSGATLAVNTSCILYITYAPTTAGSSSETLSISSDASAIAQTVSLTGTAVTTLTGAEYVPNSLQFDQVPIGSSSPLNSVIVYLYNNTGAAATYGTPAVSTGFTLGSSSCTGGETIGIGGGCDYFIQFAPTGAPGLVSGAITVPVTTPGPIITNYRANLLGYAVTPSAQVVLSATGISFPDTVQGTATGSQIIYVSNTGNEPVIFTASTLSDSTDFSITSDYCGTSFQTSGVLPNSYCYVEVGFTPGSAGALTSTLTINDNTPTGPHKVSLSGKGLAPTTSVELQPAGISFTDTPVGQQNATAQYVYLINTGNTNITISANAQICTATGNPCTASADFTINYDYCTAAGTVSAGSYCYEYIDFTPQSAGARTAVLRFNDTGTGGPHYATLSGNGVTVVNAVVADRTNCNFPDTPVGASSNSEYIYITNDGNLPVTLGAIASSSTEFQISTNECASFTIANPLPVGAQCYFYVTFSPTPSPGVQTATLAIPTSANTLSIAMQGNAITDNNTLNVPTTQVDFGQVPVGVQPAQFLYLTNTGNLPITLGTPVISDPEITTSNECGTTLLVNQNCYLYVYMQPSKTGPISGTITFNDSATGSPHVITVKATGIADQIALSQTNIDFGSWSIGTNSQPVTVYYVNQTTASVIISSVVSSAPSEFVLQPALRKW